MSCSYTVCSLFLLRLQVDYEAVKHENRRLKEDVEDMSAEIDELAKLKKIVEKNLEEALATIVQEREQKHALKKDLDQRLKTDSLYALQSLVNFSLADGRRNRDDAVDSPALKRIENEFASSDGPAEKTAVVPESTIPEPHSVVGDLFSEIHVAEVRKLEKLLEDVEIQKGELQTVVDELRERLRITEEELGARDASIEQLKAQLNNFATQPPDHDTETEDKPQDQVDTAAEELTRLRTCIGDQEERVRRLETDLTVMSQLATETQGTLSSTQDSLVQVTEDIANLYHLVCEVNGETPNRLTLEHVRGKPARRSVKSKATSAGTSSPGPRNAGESATPEDSTNFPDTVDRETERQQSIGSVTRGQSPEKERSGGGTEESRGGDPIACCKLVETINDQIKFLRGAVERSVELSRQRQNELSTGTEDTADMAEQIIKLKAMLSAKREQVFLLL